MAKGTRYRGYAIKLTDYRGAVIAHLSAKMAPTARLKPAPNTAAALMAAKALIDRWYEKEAEAVASGMEKWKGIDEST
jgi:hypothetical protein